MGDRGGAVQDEDGLDGLDNAFDMTDVDSVRPTNTLQWSLSAVYCNECWSCFDTSGCGWMSYAECSNLNYQVTPLFDKLTSVFVFKYGKFYLNSTIKYTTVIYNCCVFVMSTETVSIILAVIGWVVPSAQIWILSSFTFGLDNKCRFVF
jgi:hypothetical protein